MNIGILTLFHENYNWGGVLQGYALKTLIESSIPDTHVDILIYKGRNIVYKSKLKQALQYSPSEIFKKISGRLKSESDLEYKKRLERRNELFRQFMDKYTTNPTVYNDETLVEAARYYDCLISGSDQVWNPNVGRAGFFQEMVSDECKKISYAASIARDSLSGYERKTMIPLIEGFDAISVREKTAKDIIEKYASEGTRVTEVLDPVMMTSEEHWSALAEKSTLSCNEKYALVFCFSDSIEYREQISKYCKEHGLALKFIPFARGEYLPSDESGEADRLYDVGPYEFVNLFKNAECVFTDSFHGAVFSIVFHKNFCVFERDKQSKVSKNSRLYDLLDKFQLSDRMVRDIVRMDEVIDRKIDYAAVEALHNKYKETSMAFLKTELESCPIKEAVVKRHVAELEPGLCCGCELCVTQCPKRCIEMRRDENGFYSPYVDEEKCIKCGKCLNICTFKVRKATEGAKNAFVGYHRDGDVRASSSSGGLFYALADTVLQMGGCVYGAAYTESFDVKHCRVTDKSELSRLMTSKYVQSRMDNVFDEVLEDLKCGHQVLFSGTPCQVAALRSFIKDEELLKKLLLVDFICHGVPSPGVWESYVEYLKKTNRSKLVGVSFRDKTKGWHDFCFKAEFEGKTFVQSHETNPYMRSFLLDKNIRRSCYQCAFKDENYFADITLGDAWKIEKDYADWSDDAGVSLFVVRTGAGRELFEKIGERFEYRTVDYDKWCEYNPSLIESVNMPFGREAMFDSFKTKDCDKFWREQKKIPLKRRLRYSAKKLVKLVGVDKKLRQKM